MTPSEKAALTPSEKAAFEAAYRYLSDEAIWLSAPNMRDWYRQILVGRLGRHPIKQGKIILEKAQKGDADADFALRESASKMLRAGHPLPEPIAAYAIAIINRAAPRLKKGQKKDTLSLRDAHIVKAVELVKTQGLHPHRNDGSDRDRQSGCSIVSAVLNRLDSENDYDGFRNSNGRAFTERAIVDIWQRRVKSGASP